MPLLRYRRTIYKADLTTKILFVWIQGSLKIQMFHVVVVTSRSKQKIYLEKKTIIGITVIPIDGSFLGGGGKKAGKFYGGGG